MSLLTEASLVILPNAVKEGELLSIIPADGSGDMTAVRATTATLVNSEGVIEDCPYNLVSYSEEFDNLIKERTTVISDAIIAPNGTLTADKLVEDSSLNSHRIRQNISIIDGNTYTFSIYAKASERNKIRLFIGGVNKSCDFDLINGTLLNNTGLYASITPAEYGFFRCSITITATLTASSLFLIAILDDNYNFSYQGDGTSGIYIWGAQLVTGTEPKEYFPTTDRLNVPRLDYTNGSCPSILVEPQRTNLALNSQSFIPSWSTSFQTNATVTSTTTIDPEGFTNAVRITNVSGNTMGRVFTVTSGANYTSSIYIKRVSGFGTIEITNTNGTSLTINPTNEWQRFSINGTASSITGRFYIRVNTVGDSIEVWGAQLEAGANATSYIPTVASAVTRNADVISKSGISSLIGQTEGVIFLDAIILPATSANLEILSLNDGTSNNRLRIITATSQRLRFIFQLNGGIVQYDYTYGIGFTEQTRLKIAISYKSGNTAIYINGIKVNSSINSLTISNTLSVLNLGNNVGALYEAINSVALWKTQLTDQQCINLTTI